MSCVAPNAIITLALSDKTDTSTYTALGGTFASRYCIEKYLLCRLIYRGKAVLPNLGVKTFMSPPIGWVVTLCVNRNKHRGVLSD
jgi:hypothetical protein